MSAAERGARHVATKFPAPPAILSVGRCSGHIAGRPPRGRRRASDERDARATPAFLVARVLAAGADVAVYARYRSRPESLAAIAGLLPSWPAVVLDAGAHNSPHVANAIARSAKGYRLVATAVARSAPSRARMRSCARRRRRPAGDGCPVAWKGAQLQAPHRRSRRTPTASVVLAGHAVTGKRGLLLMGKATAVAIGQIVSSMRCRSGLQQAVGDVSRPPGSDCDAARERPIRIGGTAAAIPSEGQP